jgi:hypothetical protein
MPSTDDLNVLAGKAPQPPQYEAATPTEQPKFARVLSSVETRIYFSLLRFAFGAMA